MKTIITLIILTFATIVNAQETATESQLIRCSALCYIAGQDVKDGAPPRFRGRINAQGKWFETSYQVKYEERTRQYPTAGQTAKRKEIALQDIKTLYAQEPLAVVREMSVCSVWEEDMLSRLDKKVKAGKDLDSLTNYDSWEVIGSVPANPSSKRIQGFYGVWEKLIPYYFSFWNPEGE